MGVIDTKQVDLVIMEKRRQLLKNSKLERQRTVARFPVAIGLTAMDMQRLLNVNYPSSPPDNTQEIIDEMERQICRSYRESFGTELGQ